MLSAAGTFLLFSLLWLTCSCSLGAAPPSTNGRVAAYSATVPGTLFASSIRVTSGTNLVTTGTITATTGTFTFLRATTGTITFLRSTSATIARLYATTATIKNLITSTTLGPTTGSLAKVYYRLDTSNNPLTGDVIIQKTNPTLYMKYNPSTYTYFFVNSGGDLTIQPTGADINLNGHVIAQTFESPSGNPAFRKIMTSLDNSGNTTWSTLNTPTTTSLDNRYVTRNTDQSGLLGSKTWVNTQTFSATNPGDSSILVTGAGQNTNAFVSQVTSGTAIVGRGNGPGDFGVFGFSTSSVAVAGQNSTGGYSFYSDNPAGTGSNWFVQGLTGLMATSSTLRIEGGSPAAGSVLASLDGKGNTVWATQLTTSSLDGRYITRATNQTTGNIGNKVWAGNQFWTGFANFENGLQVDVPGGQNFTVDDGIGDNYLFIDSSGIQSFLKFTSRANTLFGAPQRASVMSSTGDIASSATARLQALTANTLAYADTNKKLASATVGTGLSFIGGTLAATGSGSPTFSILNTTSGGTGLGTYTQGDTLYYNTGPALSKLAKNTSATRYLSNTGASNNPAWGQVDLSNGVTGTLPDGNLSGNVALRDTDNFFAMRQTFFSVPFATGVYLDAIDDGMGGGFAGLISNDDNSPIATYDSLSSDYEFGNGMLSILAGNVIIRGGFPSTGYLAYSTDGSGTIGWEQKVPVANGGTGQSYGAPTDFTAANNASIVLTGAVTAPVTYMTEHSVTMTASKGINLMRGGTVVGIAISYDVTAKTLSPTLVAQVRINGTSSLATGSLTTTIANNYHPAPTTGGTGTFSAGDQLEMNVENTGGLGNNITVTNVIVTAEVVYN